MSVTLNGQLLGRTHYATRAVLERELTALGLTFAQSLLLTAVAAAHGPIPGDQAVRRLVDGLKVDLATARGVLAELVDAALVSADADHVTITDLSVDDVAATARVLETVRQRAEAALAAH